MSDDDNLGPRGLSSLNKTGWEALNKSRASNEQHAVMRSSPSDIYQNVTGEFLTYISNVLDLLVTLKSCLIR